MNKQKIKITETLKIIIERSSPMERENIYLFLDNLFYTYRNYKDSNVYLFNYFHKSIDEISKEFLEKNNNVSCKKGCSSCCHINVDIFNEEAKIIYDYLVENKIDVSIEYLKNQMSIDNKDRSVFIQGSACVFLKNKECSIYNIRPINCKKYFVINDPKLCENPNEEVAVAALTKLEIINCFLINVSEGFGSMAEKLLEVAEV